MKKFTKKTTRIAEAEMDITPMIDCTFLLLIFFLVAARIDVAVAVKLPEAKQATAVVVKHSVVLTVAAGNGEHADVFRGDGTEPANLIDAATPADQEAAITEYVDQLTSRSSDIKFVLIKAETNVKHREVSRVAKAATSPEAVQELYVAVLEQQ